MSMGPATVVSTGMSRLFDLNRGHVIGQLQPGVPQNQVAASFGGSPICKPKTKFEITYQKEAAKWLSQDDIGTIDGLLQIGNQVLLDDLPYCSLPRQSKTCN